MTDTISLTLNKKRQDKIYNKYQVSSTDHIFSEREENQAYFSHTTQPNKNEWTFTNLLTWLECGNERNSTDTNKTQRQTQSYTKNNFIWSNKQLHTNKTKDWLCIMHKARSTHIFFCPSVPLWWCMSDSFIMKSFNRNIHLSTCTVAEDMPILQMEMWYNTIVCHLHTKNILKKKKYQEWIVLTRNKVFTIYQNTKLL